MELLIPGLLLVALMVWASTKIKKQAADAFNAEFIETANYSLQKPEGFLHVIGSEEHEFMAYSSEFGKGDHAGRRQATIEIDAFLGDDPEVIRDSVIESASRSEVTEETRTICKLETDEAANEIAVRAFYRIDSGNGTVYRLRFAVLPEHLQEYQRKIEEALGSFAIKTN
ncbi:MAG: hypothetical protein ABJB34_07495 [Acidobacteriota bacterium]